MKAQFQVNHGSIWTTMSEMEIGVDGIVEPPNAWLLVRALGKRIVLYSVADYWSKPPAEQGKIREQATPPAQPSRCIVYQEEPEPPLQG